MYFYRPHSNHQSLFRVRLREAILYGTLALVGCGFAHAQEVPGCGSLQNAFGPFDYRPEKYVPETTYGSHKARLNIVERFHFTMDTQMLRMKPETPGIYPGGDLDYTLRAFPNHHHALLTLIALGELEKTSQPKQSRYSIDCWFRRAVAWKPDDTLVKIIYASYLGKTKRESEADGQLTFAASQAGDNALTLQNIGLVYFDMKNYEKALFYAHKAYELGLGIPTLKEQLKSVGKWSESTEPSLVEPSKNPQ